MQKYIEKKKKKTGILDFGFMLESPRVSKTTAAKVHGQRFCLTGVSVSQDKGTFKSSSVDSNM